MNREPSIHIGKSQLKYLLREMGYRDFPIDDFFREAKQYALNSRSIIASNKVIKRKANNIALANMDSTSLVANILYSVQIKLKHKGVRQITESNPRLWTQCKKLAEICNTFCNDFDLPQREGFIKYITLGFQRMGNNVKNYLARLSSMSENISSMYEATRELEQDNHKEETQDAHDTYCGIVASKTGIGLDYRDQPETYIYFKQLVDFCEAKGLDYNIWIKAQFSALEWCNGIPEPKNLIGDKSEERYAKYLYKNNSQDIPETPKVKGSLWDQINDSDE